MAEGFGVAVGATVVDMGEAVGATVGVGAGIEAIVGVGLTSAIADAGAEGPAVVAGDAAGSVPPQPATITSAVASIAIVRVIAGLSSSCIVGTPVALTVAAAGS